MLGFRVTIDQLVIASSVRWYCHVLSREDSLFLRRPLELINVEGQNKKDRLKRIWKKLVEEKSIKVFVSLKDAVCRS